MRGVDIVLKLRRLLGNAQTAKFLTAYYTPLFNKTKIRTKDGMIFNLRTDEQGEKYTVVEIFVNKCYTPKGFEPRKGEVVLDVGAAVGIFSLFCLTYSRDLEVIAVEPVKDSFRILKQNIKDNKAPIKALNVGLSSRKGSKTIYYSDKHYTGHSFFKSTLSDAKAMKIKTDTLKNVLKDVDSIGLMKMDCQGAEYEIIYNTPADVMRKIKRIVMECHDLDKQKKNAQAMKKHLEGLGYKVKGDDLLFAKI